MELPNDISSLHRVTNQLSLLFKPKTSYIEEQAQAMTEEQVQINSQERLISQNIKISNIPYYIETHEYPICEECAEKHEWESPYIYLNRQMFSFLKSRLIVIEHHFMGCDSWSYGTLNNGIYQTTVTANMHCNLRIQALGTLLNQAYAILRNKIIDFISVTQIVFTTKKSPLGLAEQV